jgi:hypothetical protein
MCWWQVQYVLRERSVWKQQVWSPHKSCVWPSLQYGVHARVLRGSPLATGAGILDVLARYQPSGCRWYHSWELVARYDPSSLSCNICTRRPGTLIAAYTPDNL